MQRILAIAWLTWKAAFRFRLFIVVTVLLLGAVVGLPWMLHDPHFTAQEFTQVQLTYTLSAVTALLGLATLWLACGTLARDIEECQIQVVVTKPIARWQIWLGKWLGLVSLDAALLAIAGACIYGQLLYQSHSLAPKQQETLRNEVLVARGAAREKSFDTEIEAETDKALQERLAKNPVTKADLAEVRRQIREKIKAQIQVVPPGTYRTWEIDLGFARHSLKGQPLFLRVKFNAAEKSPSGTFTGLWQVGVPDKTKLWTSGPMSLAPDTFHEIQIDPDLFDANGVLTISFANLNNTTLIFPLEDGMEVLYREGGFGLNFIRGLGIIFCWMTLFATLGLSAASFLSFPVAAFASLAALTLTLSTGTLASVVEQGTVMGANEETGAVGHSAIDAVAVPLFRGILNLINLAKDFSPVDALSTGRSIPWPLLGQAFGQIVLLLGGVLAVFGIWTFSRRELATAQGTQ
ncbi:MAG TPA: ABC transporter permease subunit [Verrucomicrobiae bacterium]|nr:ABC transporter permease subunit [Verrucomicrobiae bacterium]